METNNLFEINALVYVAGILVPYNSITVNSAFNSIPMATVTLPPYPQLYGIGRRDRLPVQIFVQDTLAETNEYFLLFEGEVQSFSYLSTALNKEIVINAQGVMSFLMDVKSFFMESIKDLASRVMIPEENNTSIYSFEPHLTFPMSLFMKGIAPIEEEQLITVPSEFLANVYKYMEELSSMNEFNDSAIAKFYSGYTGKLNLKKRIAKVSHFDEPDTWDGTFPVLQGMRTHAAILQLMGRATNAVQQGKTGDTFYNWLNYLVSEMQYELCFPASPTMTTNLEGEESLGISIMKPMLYEAHPPKCNIFFRSQVDSIRTQETVYQVPTRVRTDDIQGVMAMLTGGSDDPITRLPRVKHYPTKAYKDKSAIPSEEDNINIFSSDFLDTEEFTGPYLFDTSPPTWSSYMDFEDMEPEEIEDYWERILAYLLQLKVYESRTMTSTGGFNPFITAGFPGVVFDAEDDNFVFAGHVTAVNHSITKQQARTTVSLGFTRLIDEAIDYPIENPFDEVSAISTDPGKLEDIYQSTIGSSVIPFSEVKVMREAEENNNPIEAYKFNKRSIVTLEEYLGFMGLSVQEEIDFGYGESVPSVLGGDYVEKRMDDRDPATIQPLFPPPDNEEKTENEEKEQILVSDYTGIRAILKEIADRGFDNKIY